MEDFENEFNEEIPAPKITGEVTTEQIKQAIERVYQLAKEEAEAEAARSKITKLKMSAEALVISLLEAAKMDEFPSEYGKFSLDPQSTLSFATVDKSLFYPYLKAKGDFEALATIHAKTFLGYYNREEKKAIEEGRGMEFSMPGVPEPKIYTKLKYKKPKVEG